MLAVRHRAWLHVGLGLLLAVLLLVVLVAVPSSLSTSCDGDEGSQECETS